ncbi:hypothetical protein J4209_00280 [Candidatus Woesearchaeota archaeon]|nr:hypothetical protein [Candidatus Woesearchaeota archaeon]
MAKKRCLLVIFLLFCIAPIINATEEVTLFNDWVYAGQNITVGDKAFSFGFGTDPQKIAVSLPSGTGVIADKGSCQINEDYDVCFTDSKIGYHNYTLDKDIYQASVKISQLIAKLEFTRTIGNTNFLIQEGTKITTTFKNVGSKEASDISFTDSFPASLPITDISGCILEGNSAVFRGSLGINRKKECIYEIKAVNWTTYESKAALSYDNGFELMQLSDSEKIAVPPNQFEITDNMTKEFIEAGEEADISFILKNLNSDYKIIIGTLYLEIPLGIKVLNYPGILKKDYEAYKWDGELAPLESKTLSFRLKGKTAGSYKIKEYSEFIINNNRNIIDDYKIIKVGAPDLLVNYEISETTLYSGEKTLVTAYLTNPSSTTTFGDIAFKIDSDTPNFQLMKTKDELKPGDTRAIVKTYFVAPNVTETTNYIIKISAEYIGDGIKNTVEKDETIIVLALEETTEDTAGNITNITSDETLEKEENITTGGSEIVGFINETKANASAAEENTTAITFDLKGNFSRNIIGISLIFLVIAGMFILFIHEKKTDWKEFRMIKRRIKKAEGGEKKEKKEPKEKELPKKTRLFIDELFFEKLKKIAKKEKELLKEKEMGMAERFEKIKEGIKKEGKIRLEKPKKEEIKEKEVEKELKELEEEGKKEAERLKHSRFRF